MRLEPQPGDVLHMGKDEFEFTVHPAVPLMAFGQEGRKSIVYQLKSASDGKPWAIKVFKQVFRGPYVIEVAERIARYADLPGMRACKRTVLTQDEDPRLVQQYPELAYAVLMPWVADQTWQDIMLSNAPLPREQSLTLARATADVLSNLETRGLAHCDIAGSNVLINAKGQEVHLVDLEDMYGPDLSPPTALPAGTSGYQHPSSRTSSRGQWCAEGDRFSSAILLAEMLTWHDPRIVKLVYGEHYFAEEEIQDTECKRYELMLEVLGEISRGIAGLFERAWTSPILGDCPSLKQWADAFQLFELRAELLRAMQDENDAEIVRIYHATSLDWSDVLAPNELEQVDLALQRLGAPRRVDVDGEKEKRAEPSRTEETLREPIPPVYLGLVVDGDVSRYVPLHGEVQLGRGKSNSVVVDDPKASRHHARVAPVGDYFVISDLGSTNGTYVNGFLITQPTPLKNKDSIRIGNTTFRFIAMQPDIQVAGELVVPSAQPRFSWLSRLATLRDAMPSWTVVGCILVSVVLALLCVLGILLGYVWNTVG
jgi:serine/threonine protein kinase